ncbi:sorbosone dehydrogenase family protein [uncultured Nocardioides sp.]|uniref:PQQ-dependent sugar dehydrogenase n=1 Tax=uncultured Nocardioides sp. TaxID=198441 RepID=UPI002632A8E7|nr:PQQ-dependent sugar dehydrogenase [uncultured Nocardioides sp.]
MTQRPGRRRRLLAAAGATVLPLALSGCLQEGSTSTVTIIETTATGTPLPVPTSAPASTAATGSPTDDPTDDGEESGPPELVGTIATGLEVPWGIAFLPDGDALVTERDSTRVLLLRGPEHEVVEVATVDAAAPAGEGGLLGVAVSPSYDDDGLVYLYLTTPTDNRVVRGVLEGERLGELEPVLTGIPNGFIHDGGQLVFGPDGYLYVSTGEAGDPPRAADPDDLGGKVLRITPDGDPAPGNPDPDSPVWTLGHRNIQGLAFVGTKLWASEFGQDRFDELNLITAGRDYGWPAVEGEGGKKQGYVDPQVTWATDDASPSGLAYADGRLWLGALKGQRLWRVEVKGKKARKPRAFFVGDHGRLRSVVAAPDGTLWVTTSNRDGRGSPVDGDDKILQIRP